jgi:hypothetical protein
MTRIFSLTFGIALVAVGGLLLGFNFLVPALGLAFVGLLKLWPLILVAVSMVLILPPVLAPQHKGLGAMFIPGLPILAVSGIALLANFWKLNAWAIYWPQIILALALGFILAAMYLKVIWLIVPAFIIGFVGAALQFSTLTQFWQVWSVAWSVVPLAIGLSLAIIGLTRRSVGLILIGLFICGTISCFTLGLATVITGSSFGLNVVIGAGLLVSGGLLLALNWVKPIKLAA